MTDEEARALAREAQAGDQEAQDRLAERGPVTDEELPSWKESFLRAVAAVMVDAAEAHDDQSRAKVMESAKMMSRLLDRLRGTKWEGWAT